MPQIIPVAIIIVAYVATISAIIVAIETVLIVAIIAAIIATGASLAATYYLIQGDVQKSMMFSGIAIAAGVGGVYIGYASMASESALLMAEGTAQAVAASEAAQASATMTIAAYAQSVYTTYETIVDAFHLKLLYQVHQVAYLVSEDYRQAAQGVFNQVAKISEVYGFGSLTLNLLFENTRTSVLDISTAMGSSFDLAELKWMVTYNEILKEFSRNATNYQQNPHALFYWLTNNVHRPGYDAKSATMRAAYTGIESALSLITATTKDAIRIRNDLTKLVADLPVAISGGIMPEIRKINKDIDNWIKLNYDPAVKVLTKGLTDLGKDLKGETEKVKALNQRLLRPGRYLREIRTLPPEQKQEDLNDVSSLAADGMVEDMTLLNDGIKSDMEKVLTEEE